MNQKKVKCPSCRFEQEIIGDAGKTITITCPNCNTKGIFLF